MPGFKPPGSEETDWTSPRAAPRLAAFGALGGAVIGWIISLPDGLDSRLELGAELFGLAAAGLVLMRTMRDMPAVGEAPPDDPEQDFRTRVRNAALKLGGAALMLGFVWLTLD